MVVSIGGSFFQNSDPPEAAATRNRLLGKPKTRKSHRKISKDVVFQKYDPPEAAATRNPLLEKPTPPGLTLVLFRLCFNFVAHIIPEGPPALTLSPKLQNKKNNKKQSHRSRANAEHLALSFISIKAKSPRARGPIQV